MQISRLISQNVVDERICSWITPDFSTTTRNYVVVSSIMMMGTLQAYFVYKAYMWCGIPYVTLLGTKQDYEEILSRLQKLALFGEELTAFSGLLKPIIKNFIQSFDDPDHSDVVSFWQNICRENNGSGSSDYTGWITAFRFKGAGRSTLVDQGCVWMESTMDRLTYKMYRMDSPELQCISTTMERR